MRTLDPKEMMQVQGGVSGCKVVGVITALSCYAGLAIACLIGSVGYLVVCDAT